MRVLLLAAVTIKFHEVFASTTSNSIAVNIGIVLIVASTMQMMIAHLLLASLYFTQPHDLLYVHMHYTFANTYTHYSHYTGLA
jgi:membrane protein YdbS with pleckstrin-like domain